jgi:hypothetical protein
MAVVFVTIVSSVTFVHFAARRRSSAALRRSEPTPVRRAAAATSIVVMCPLPPRWASAMMKPSVVVAAPLNDLIFTACFSATSVTALRRM